MKGLLLFLLLPLSLFAQFSAKETARYKQQASRVNIIRDHWGIPHVYGRSDADAVFGLLYAQCEDDFPRLEMNYIEKLGRMAEVKGDAEIFNDLYIRMVIDSAEAIADYQKAEPWLKELLNAFADGINFYLYKHPDVKPVLLRHFEPWYPLLWTDGSIGAISTGGLTSKDLQAFYNDKESVFNEEPEIKEITTGSNGFAIGPSKTASHNSILYINPHVTFYFRPEVHMISEEGLNVYGAVTWGQFFIYPGFNEHCGWMHTSSDADVSDLYKETIVEQKEKLLYSYENKLLPVAEKKIVRRSKTATGFSEKIFTAYSTHHGPIMGKRKNEWLSVRSNNRSMTGLIQSWRRTKAKGFEDYKKIMSLGANTSNNTVFADDKGNIAYWHGNFMPIRDTAYDWSRPVPGNITATEWKGMHSVQQVVHSYNPPNGWLQNCNSTPFTVAGVNSPQRKNYPAYMAPDGENFRGVNAVRVLSKAKNMTIDKTIAAGYDTYLAAFEILVPALVRAFDETLTAKDSLYAELKEPIDVLRKWNYRSGENSVATSLAVEWGSAVWLGAVQSCRKDEFQDIDDVDMIKHYVSVTSSAELIKTLSATVNKMTQRFGIWNIPWGNINRFQRLSGDIDQQFVDSAESIPVGFTSSTFGQLPSYSSRYFKGTKKRYGVNGNSFICAVEFGKKVKAKSLLAGGESGNPSSKHFKDQALMYSKGIFKDVLFYKKDVEKHAEKRYHPGE